MGGGHGELEGKSVAQADEEKLFKENPIGWKAEVLCFKDPSNRKEAIERTQEKVLQITEEYQANDRLKERRNAMLPKAEYVEQRMSNDKHLTKVECEAEFDRKHAQYGMVDIDDEPVVEVKGTLFALRVTGTRRNTGTRRSRDIHE